MKKILINEEPWQTRIAIIDDGKLQNIYFWSHSANHLERSFFKGKVTKVLPGIQTAFVEIGQAKSGFLHISEIDRELAINRMSGTLDDGSDEKKEKKKPHKSPDIGKILKENETILIQVSKEPVNEKGAKLTTCYTLPGRFLVLMPNIPRVGTSKKIEDREERHRLKELVSKNLPEGMGAIIRTCSEGRKESEIKQDLKFLVNTWNEVLANEKKAEAPAKIYQDINLSFQVIRDHLDEDVEAVVLDDKTQQKELARYVKQIAPEYSTKIKTYTGKTPLFSRYKIEEQIKESLHKKVELQSGGSIVIEATEAMTVVDVNTGRFVGKTNLEDTILKTNLEAAQEVVRQLKIRNVGGLIVIDFIDMATHSNRQKLFRFFEKTLKEQDKFQSVVLRISEFGLVQMTRKRSGKTLNKQLMDDCSNCKGTGLTPSVRAESYNVLHNIKQELESGKPTGTITLKLNPEVFEYISSTEYQTLLEFEKKHACKVVLQSQKGFEIPQFKLETSA
jgi:ribonuclease G